MKIMGKVTKRSLIYNKRRTLLTAVGLMLAVSLLTAITVFMGSLLHTYRETYRAHNGNWIATVNSEAGIRDFSNLKPDDVFWTQNQGFSEFNIEYDNRRYVNYLEWKALRGEDFKQGRFNLEKGRLPAREGEILVDVEWARREGFLNKLDQTIEVPVGKLPSSANARVKTDEEMAEPNPLEEATMKKFTIVGLVRGLRNHLDRNGHDIALVYSDHWNETGPMVGYLNWMKPKASTLKELKASVGEQNLELNRGLLETYMIRGYFRHLSLADTFVGLAYIVLFLVMLPIVAIFSNAFGISLAERVRHMGMLSSVGATKRQLRQSVFLEASILALIGILPGILLGIVGIGITLFIIGDWASFALGQAPIQMHIEPFWILSSVAFSLLMVFLASLYPAWRAGKIMPLQAIRSQDDVKLTKREVKTSPLFQKLFGIEGALALKNMKRNRKSFRFTLFSLVCSIIVFIGSASLMDHIQGALEVGSGRADYNVEVTLFGEKPEEILTQITKLNSAEPKEKVVHGTYTHDYLISKEAKGNPKEDVVLPIIALPDAELEKAGIPLDAFAGPGLKLWFNDLSYTIQGDDKYVEKHHYYDEKGAKDYRYIYQMNYGDVDEHNPATGTASDVEIVGYSQKAFDFAASPKNYVFLLMPESKLHELKKLSEGESNANFTGKMYFTTEQDQELERALGEIVDQKDNQEALDFYIENITKYQRGMINLHRFVSVLLYGMLVLMTLTALTNGYNAILTFYTLRQREFSVLRSLGMEEKSFRRMIRFESMLYGSRALLWGIPLSMVLVFLIWKVMMNSIDLGMLIPWRALLITTVAIGLFVWLIMQMAWRRIRKLSIVENIRKEVI